MNAIVLDDDLPPREPGGGAQQPRGMGARLILLAAALAVLGAVASIVVERVEGPELFPIRAVRFDGGLANVRDQDLRSAVSSHLDGGLLGVDVNAIRHAVESLPWVASASVRRVWPDALRVTVTEQQPVALWGDSGLVNGEGTVFTPASRPTDLPRLAGPKGTAPEVLKAFRRLRQRLDAIGLEVVGLQLDKRRSWKAALADRGELMLGQKHRGERLKRLVRAWPSLRTTGRVPARIDLRYPNGFAVQWRKPGTNDSNAPKD